MCFKNKKLCFRPEPRGYNTITENLSFKPQDLGGSLGALWGALWELGRPWGLQGHLGQKMLQIHYVLEPKLKNLLFR